MDSPFDNVRFHVEEKTEAELEPVTARPKALRGARTTSVPRSQFDSDEAAARYFLGRVLERDDRPTVRSLSAPQRPEVVPDMRLRAVQDSPLTKTKIVRFVQTKSNIPIFGSNAVIELTEKRQLVSINADVAQIKKISPVPAISQQQALGSIAKLAKVDPAAVTADEPAELTFYFDEKAGNWHLAYFFKQIPIAPADFARAAGDRKSYGHGPGPSPRKAFLQLNYLIDAHDGGVLFYYSAHPLLSLSRCKGIDELNASHVFYGLQNGLSFELSDPLRRIKTYDLQLTDVGSPLPANPLRCAKADWGTTNRAAISAHVNAQRVYDFYKSVLMRDGIDDKGMELISVVNCTYSAEEVPPQWHNAVWWQNRMWYGQDQGGDDTLRSYARYLDIIAHELTHGVTEYSSDLVYQDQSGALNESFSDIFGIIINNWYTVGPDSDVAGWSWEIGPGLGNKGKPLRDLSKPKRTGDPDHMKNYLQTASDFGGVHTNSNIHNKAAYNVFTAVDNNGHRAFPPRDVVVLYYLCLQRLGQLADFSKILQTLIDVASTYYAGDPEERKAKVKHIENAYKRVGIVNKKAARSPKKVGYL